MLYRNPERTLASWSLGRLIWQSVAARRRAHRRRLAQLDLMSLSPHLKADLGLRDGCDDDPQRR